MYNKKVLQTAKKNLGKAKQPAKPKDIIYDSRGQWDYPGEVTRIPSNQITMQGVPYPVLAVTDRGQQQMMYPEQEYEFDADYVDEYPQMKRGGYMKGLVPMPKPSKKGLASKAYSRSLDATNRLFTENTLFKKPKDRKRKVFDPNAKYYAEGGFIETELTDEEIQAYKDGGYIVEDISVPELQDGGEEPKLNLDLPEQAVYGNEEKRKLQGSLIDKYTQAKKAYQDYRENAGLSKQRLKSEGASSIGVLKGQVKEYKGQLEEEKKSFDRAQKALNVLQKKDPENWKNKKLKDVMSPQGVDALRSLYKDGKMSDASFKYFYDNFGNQYDREATKTTAEDQVKLEDSWYGKKDEQGRRRWMSNPMNVKKVAQAVAVGAPLAPFAPAVLANPLVQAGLTGYGAYDATTNTLPAAYRNYQQGEYAQMTGNLGMAALDLLPIPLVGTNVIDDLTDAGKYLHKTYNKVATGNSRLTADFNFPAWKLEKPVGSLSGATENSRNYIARTNTDREAELLSKFGKGMNFTPEEWAEMEALTKSGATDFSKSDIPISRIPLYYNRSERAVKEADALNKLRLWQKFSTPSEKSIRTWSAGIPEGYSPERLARSRPNEKIRLVIPSRYTKDLGDNFAAMPYDDTRVDFIHQDPRTGMRPYFNYNASLENELMGNIPEGFIKIGSSNEGGYKNIIIKPIKKKKKINNQGDNPINLDPDIPKDIDPTNNPQQPIDKLPWDLRHSPTDLGGTSLIKYGDEPHKGDPFYHIDPADYKGIDAYQTTTLNASDAEIEAGDLGLDATQQMEKEYESISKTIEDIRADKVHKWQTPEGQRRLQYMIDNTPGLKNAGVTPQSYVESIVGMTNKNKIYLDNLVELDKINGQQMRVDFDYDLGYIDREEWMNQTIDLENTLTQKKEDLLKIRNDINYNGPYNASMTMKRPLDLNKSFKTAIKGYDEKGLPIIDWDNFKPIASDLPFDKFLIGIGEANNPSDLKQLIQHEIGHLLQKGDKTVFDNLLSELELKPNDLFSNKPELFSKPINKGWNEFKKSPVYFSRSKNYFETGSEGKEKLPFALELRQDLLDKNLLKNEYDKITPELLQKHFNMYNKGINAEKTMPLRLYDIMENKKSNFKIISDVLNNVGVLIPGVVGAGLLMDKEKKGGAVNRSKLQKFIG